MKRILINFAGFQAGWFACALGAAHGMAWIGPAVVAVVVALHLWTSGWSRSEAALIAAVGALGAAADSLHAVFGTLRFQGEAGLTAMFVMWIGAFWVNFAATLTVSFRWLAGKWALAAVMGAVGGPTTYYAGAKLGAIEFHATAPLWTWIALAVQWALAMPLLVMAAGQVTGAERAAAARRAMG